MYASEREKENYAQRSRRDRMFTDDKKEECRETILRWVRVQALEQRRKTWCPLIN